MKSKIKSIIQKALPTEVFVNLYTLYARATCMGIANDKLSKYARFSRAGLYDFQLHDTKFMIKLDPANGGVDAEIYADGHYEPAMLETISKYLTGQSIFLDIGANIGQHSLYASRYARHVYSFEPIERLYNQMRESIYANDFLNISAYNYALGNRREVLPIYGSGSNMGGSTLVTNENRTKVQDIRVLRLDDVYSEIGIERCDLVKIDVEGYELDVLLGARDLISKYKPKIIIEYSPVFYRKVDNAIGENIYRFLKDLDYRIYNLDSALDDKEVRSFDDIRDLDQTNIFCI